MNERLRLVLAGMGGCGRYWAKEILPASDQVTAAGYVDPNPDARSALGDEPPVFASLTEALDRVEADAVVIAADLRAHAPLTKEALMAGKHVLCEKPFTPTPEAARELAELAASRKCTLMVSQNYRFFPAPRTVRALIDEGSLGALYRVSVDFRRFSRRPEGVPRPEHLLGQPLLSDMAIHHFDLMRYLVSQPIERLYCDAWNPPGSGFSGPPVATMAAAFAGGVGVSYRGSFASPGAPTPWAGEWRMELERGEITWTSRAEGGTDDADRVRLRTDGRSTDVPLRATPLIDRHGTLGEFADAVRSARQPECSAADNAESLAISAAAIASATSHRPVTP